MKDHYFRFSLACPSRLKLAKSGHKKVDAPGKRLWNSPAHRILIGTEVPFGRPV
jgi:hypothetical protein